MNFEWNEEKRMSNIAKHRIDFIDARAVFYDTCRVTVTDNRCDYGEIRENTVGMLESQIIATVTHTDRNGITRIISARQASKKERNLYYGTR
jgi:uncharacterized DUF497 family protein